MTPLEIIKLLLQVLFASLGLRKDIEKDQIIKVKRVKEVESEKELREIDAKEEGRSEAIRKHFNRTK